MAGLSLDFSNGSLDPMELENVNAMLERFLAELINAMQIYLDAEDKNASGNLRESMEAFIFNDPGVVHATVQFPNAAYWMYVEHGVKGAQTEFKAPNSPFKFGSRSREYAPGTMREAIRTWLGHRRFQWRDAKGRFLSYDDMTPPITRSVYLHGIEPTPFVSDSLERVWRRYTPLMAEAFAEDLEVYIDDEGLFEQFEISLSI